MPAVEASAVTALRREMDMLNVYRLSEALHIDPELGGNVNFIASVRYTPPLHCHEFFEFLMITEGECLNNVNGSVQNLKEGSLVLMRPDDMHSYDYNGGGDCKFVNVFCTVNLMEEVIGYLGAGQKFPALVSCKMPPCVNLSPQEKDHFISQCENLSILATIDKKRASIQLRGMLAATLAKDFLLYQKAIPANVPLWFEGLLTKMQRQENFTEGIDRMYELSEKSAGHVNRLFKQRLNITPTTYINRLRLNFARYMLLTTDMSIIEISMYAGFDNLSYFYRLFKQRFSLTPADLRKSQITA
jgi:AraC family cel operon transcriptional repressor